MSWCNMVVYGWSSGFHDFAHKTSTHVGHYFKASFLGFQKEYGK